MVAINQVHTLLPVVDLVDNAWSESEATCNDCCNANCHLVVENKSTNGEKDKAQIDIDGDNDQENQNSNGKSRKDEHQPFFWPIFSAPTANKFLC